MWVRRAMRGRGLTKRLIRLHHVTHPWKETRFSPNRNRLTGIGAPLGIPHRAARPKILPRHPKKSTLIKRIWKSVHLWTSKRPWSYRTPKNLIQEQRTMERPIRRTTKRAKSLHRRKLALQQTKHKLSCHQAQKTRLRRIRTWTWGLSRARSNPSIIIAVVVKTFSAC